MVDDWSLKTSLEKQDPNINALTHRKDRQELIYYNIQAYLQSVKYTYAALYLLDDLLMKSSISPSTDLWGKKSITVVFCPSSSNKASPLTLFVTQSN